MKQLTLAKPFTLQGKGLHTGLNITATFNPAAEGTGYKIQRVDLEDRPIIPAVAENVVATSRGTVIGIAPDITVSTIEHAMAALYASGIDNVLISVDGPEMPILDGSAAIYTHAIAQAGLQEQDADKEFFVVRHKIEVSDPETGSKIIVLPDEEFTADVMINFDSPVLHNQYASLEHLSDFADEIAASRTFVFVREIEQLLAANLIKGGDLDNAIVIYDSPLSQDKLDHIADIMGVQHKCVTEYGYINETPLTHENEPARHKLLDIIGDIALIGAPLRGRIIATRPGHTINTQLSKKLRSDVRRIRYGKERREKSEEKRKIIEQ